MIKKTIFFSAEKEGIEAAVCSPAEIFASSSGTMLAALFSSHGIFLFSHLYKLGHTYQ
jgi:hypothetical protein